MQPLNALYRPQRNMEPPTTTQVSGTKFSVVESGKTNGAHQTIVTRLKDTGFTEVTSPEQSDFLVVFCPIASRVGTDISTALETISGDKPVILVVMHHTFENDKVVVDSRRLVDKANVRLTVDCLFYEGKLLTCDRNEKAQLEILSHLEVPPPPITCLFSQVNPQETSETLVSTENGISDPSVKKFFVFVVGKTNGAHQTIVLNLKKVGQAEVKAPEGSDYILVFCPIVSRVGTDISTALEKIPGDKPVILVVMHHTFEQDKAVAKSRRLVDQANVELTVDCLFYEGKLLDCRRNEDALTEISKYLGVSFTSQTDKPKQQKKSSSPQTATVRDESHDVKRSRINDESPSTSTGGVSTVPTNAVRKWKRFYVEEQGTTLGADQTIVKALTGAGQAEVKAPQHCDYRLVFCPIITQAELDINRTLTHIPGDKPVILVVMHHTFETDKVLPDSGRLVNRDNVFLTVDCLFHEGKLLHCKRNNDALTQIMTFLGVSQTSQPTSWERFTNWAARKLNL